MTITELLTFAGALFLMAITPGPAVLACVSKSFTSGFKMSTYLTYVGFRFGDVRFGLAAIAELMGDFFAIVRYLGAAYLIWLGYRAWTSKGKTQTTQYQEGSSPAASYLGGLCLTLGNPKAIVFYLSFFPAFFDRIHLQQSHKGLQSCIT